MTSKQQLQMISIALLVAVAVGGLFWLDSAPAPTLPAPTPSVAALPKTAAPGAEVGVAPAGPSGTGEPASAASVPMSAASSSNPAAAEGARRVYTEAELALPPEEPDPPGADACALLKKDEESLGFTTTLLEKLPEVNKDTLGAARLRAMHARLESSVARRRAALSGVTCPGN